MSEIIRLPDTNGFHQISTNPATALTVFVSKPDLTNEYSVGDVFTLSGMCSYRFLSAAGIIRGIAFRSPALHTVVTPILLRIGTCPGPFCLNISLQQLGLLLYESADGGFLIIPVDVRSPLLVEVET